MGWGWWVLGERVQQQKHDEKPSVWTEGPKLTMSSIATRSLRDSKIGDPKRKALWEQMFATMGLCGEGSLLLVRYSY